MKCSKVFFLLIVFITGCGKSDFAAKEKSSQLDPSFLAKILVSVGRRASYRGSNNDYPDFVANAHLGKAETSESAYCKLNRTDVTRFSSRYTRYVNQVFNSLKVEIPQSCQSFQGFGEPVGEMGCEDPNGCSGYETKEPGESVGEMGCEDSNGCGGYGPLNPGGPENQPKDPAPENQPKDPAPENPTEFPGSECKITWEYIPGTECFEFYPGVLICCPGSIGPR
ncbi:MAG: hypothetical protein IPJ71_02980 [Bdellovibrionales bacterium]|nr:hypothetical protein [Bdellovibrionales bacterium]